MAEQQLLLGRGGAWGRGHRQPAAWARQPVEPGARSAAAGLGRRNRLHKLGPAAAHIHPGPARGDLCDPGDLQPRAAYERRSRRRLWPPPTPRSCEVSRLAGRASRRKSRASPSFSRRRSPVGSPAKTSPSRAARDAVSRETSNVEKDRFVLALHDNVEMPGQRTAAVAAGGHQRPPSRLIVDRL
jgi:hypothetical protein